MTKYILDVLRDSTNFTKEFIKHLAVRKIDMNEFLTKRSDVDAFGEFVVFIAVNYNGTILIRKDGYSISVNGVAIVNMSAKCSTADIITAAIITAIVYFNNPF
jgi:hypothetical protein